MKKHTTKRALLSSALSLLLCVAMLIGTTFAWFTDSVTSANNIIMSGNLDVELEYSTDMTTWHKVDTNTNIFDDEALWEPGYTEVVYLRVSNKGSLALKYKLGVNVAGEVIGKTKDGGDIQLSKYIEYGVVENVTNAYGQNDRTDARAAVTEATRLNTPYSKEFSLAAKADPATFALVVYMPESIGNEANHDGTNIPVINLGLSVQATQDTVEEDSFNNQYDATAEYDEEKEPAWDKVTTQKPAQENGYYVVGTPAELAWLAENGKIQKVSLTADIDMLGATIEPIDLDSYSTIEGNNHKISNVVVSGSGLFGTNYSKGDIRNIKLDNITVNAPTPDDTLTQYAGVVNGRYSGKYTNVTVSNSKVNASDCEYVGGLAGAVYMDMTDCKVENTTVTGKEKVGGLIGFFSLTDAISSITLKNCSASNVTVTATSTEKPYAGVFFGRGLADGSWKFTFTDCTAAMKAGQVLIGHDYNRNIDVSAIAVKTIQ